MKNAITSGRMTVKEVISATTAETLVLTPRTIAKHIGSILSISDVAFGKGLAGDRVDPFAKFKKTRVRKVAVKRYFETNELDALSRK